MSNEIYCRNCDKPLTKEEIERYEGLCEYCDMDELGYE